MTYEEKALMILEVMDKTMQIDWNLKNLYIKAIIDGLKELDEITKMADEKKSTAAITDNLVKREGVQMFDIGYSESAKMEVGPIKCELTGPAKLIVNYD